MKSNDTRSVESSRDHIIPNVINKKLRFKLKRDRELKTIEVEPSASDSANILS